jgi:hypothetical protein
MNIVKTLAVGTFLASTLVAGTAFAKGHDQGRGNDSKPTNAGFTDVQDTVDNTPGADRRAGTPMPRGGR